ncbi:MAG: DUF3847 domain-containing protein [Blautia massiliensis (ex Durand et al. 2017)]
MFTEKEGVQENEQSKNPKYESMSLEELKANMEKSRQELEAAIHHKNILEQRKKLVERRERSHRLIVKGAEFEKVFPLSRDLEQEDVQDMMNQLQNSSYNKSIVRQAHIAALHKDQQQIAEAVKRQRREMTVNGTVSFFSKECIQRERADGGRFRSLYFRAEDF